MLREPSHTFEKVVVSVGLLFLLIGAVIVAFVTNSSLQEAPEHEPTTVSSTTITPTQTSGRQKIQLKGDFAWRDPGYEPLGSQKIWEPIASGRLLGLGLPGISEVAIGCGVGDNPTTGLQEDVVQHLRSEGGLCRRYIWLEYEAGPSGKTTEIRSEEELAAALEPIDSAAEASSFLGALLADVATTNSDIYLEGTTTSVTGGFLVQLVKKNTFGCGNHAPQKVIYYVTEAGEYTLVAEEIVDQNAPSASPGLCVD